MGIIETDEGQQIFTGTLTPTADAESDLLAGDGTTTDVYNDSGANSTAFLKTNLPRVDHAQVTVAVNDGALSTSAVGVVVADARPAEESDWVATDDHVPGAILFTLVDEDGSGEIADDTDITSLEFEVVATQE